MKRFISLILTLLMLMMSINTVVFAATELTLNGTDVINTTLGDGYYDSKCNESRTSSLNVECNSNICSNCPENGTGYHYPFTANGNVSLGTTVILNHGDWAKYNISSLDEGAYEVSISYGSKKVNNKVLTITFETNDGSVVSNTLPDTGTENAAYSNYADGVIGTLQLSGNQETVKMLATNASAYIPTITFTKIAPPSVSSWSSNADVSDGVVARGADLFTITMSEAVKPANVTADTVKILKDGVALSADVSLDGAVITIDLKESLEFGADYTLFVDDSVTSVANNIAMDADFEDEFSVDGSDMTGEATITVSSYESGNGTITASGQVKSSQGLGIKGRDVYLYIKHQYATEATLVETVTTGENGAFEFILYEIDANANGGKYFVEISSDYVSVIYENSMLFFNEGLEEDIKNDFSSAETPGDVKDAVETHGPFLDVDLGWAKEILDTDEDTGTDGLEDVYAEMVGKEFATANDAINAFKQAVYFDVLVKTEDAEDIKEILDDPLKAAVIEEFNAPLWNALEDGGKDTIAEDALSLTPSDLDELAGSLNEAVKDALIAQFGIAESEISFSSSEVLAGENAEIALSLDEAIEDVSKMYFEIAYDEAAASLFEGDGIEAVVPAGMDYEISASNGIMTIEVTAEEPVDIAEGEFVTISIPALKSAKGTHDLSVSGYITYHPEAISHLEETFEMDFVSMNDPTITVNVLTNLTLNGTDVINQIEGDGFHDVKGLEFTNVNVSSGTTVILNLGDWDKYNISALAAGKYEISISYGSTGTPTMTFETNDGNAVSKTLPTTGEYATYTEGVVGMLQLSGNQETVKMSATGAGVYVPTITFTLVEALKMTEWSGNAGVSNGVVPRGTDRFTIIYNNELKAQSITDASVSVKAKSGAVVPAKVSVSGNIITIDLKETLSYSTEYEISVNAVDKYEQTIADTVAFKTADDSNQAGSSSIVVDTFKVDGNEFTAEGTVLSSGGVGIKGRTVKLSAKAQNGSTYDVWAEGVSGEDGAFVLSYTFSDSAESGKYEAKIKYEYGASAYEADAYYFDEESNATISSEFSNLSEADFEAKLNEYAERFGLDMETMEGDIDVSFIINNMANREYDKVADIIDEVNARYALEKVNQAADADAVEALIDDADALEAIAEIQRDKWDILADETQTAIATEIKDGGRIEEPIDLIEKIDELINKALEELFDFAAATVSVTSADVNIGQSAVITFAASEKQENVAKVRIVIEYSEEEAELFKENVTYTLSKDLEDLTVIPKNEDGKLIFDLIVNQNEVDVIKKVSFRDEIITIGFKAETGMEGTYSPIVSGYVTYHSDEAPQSEAYFADVPFEVIENPTIKVNKISTDSKKDYSGGGGTPGGNNYVPSDVGANNDDIPSVVGGDKPPVSTGTFNDLGSALWAKEGIEALAAKGIINGRGDGTFAPNDIVTRAEFCKMITLAFDAVKADAACDFKDVSGDSWFYSYVASAKAAGFINGKTDEDFAPFDTMSREEMVAVALRALGAEAAEAEEKFADDDAISDYAKAAVYTLKKLGILDGVGENKFAPKALVTRAMAAKVIYALITV